jgi:hypothetical protein
MVPGTPIRIAWAWHPDPRPVDLGQGNANGWREDPL